MLFEVTIPGRAIVKKNTKRIIGYGRKKRVIYSPKYLEWEKIALLACNRAKGPILLTELMYAEFKFYFKNQQGEADTSNLVEGPQDVLKSSGVIQDDKLIHAFYAQKIFDAKEEPRVHVKLFKYSPGMGR